MDGGIAFVFFMVGALVGAASLALFLHCCGLLNESRPE